MSKKNESLDRDECMQSVLDHIKDHEKVLQRLEGVGLTFSRDESAFGQ